MRLVRTKIIATVGPASRDPEILTELIREGVDVFRVNAAHTPAEELAPWVRRIRRAAKTAGRTVATLVDLPGTKVRVGSLGSLGGIDLVEGQRVEIVRGSSGGNARRIPVSPMPWLDHLARGSRVLLADGQIELSVVGSTDDGVNAEVVQGGHLLAGKGADFPGARLPTRVPTARDVKLLEAAFAADADAIALSFVRNGKDVERARKHLGRLGNRDFDIVSKIEREDAVEDLDDILVRSNQAIVARGDLGVDVGPERVPSLQRQILEACRRHGRPGYIATEMLETMIERSRPTRAEASDVAGSVFEGADGVMLSAETAVGKHPVLAVRTMDRILAAAEADPSAPYALEPGFVPPDATVHRRDQHVVRAAVVLASQVQAAAIVVFTREGASALRMSKERPRAPILAYAPYPHIVRRLALAWGVRPRRLPTGRNTDARVEAVAKRLRDEEGLPPGSAVVLVMGGATDPVGTTTMIKLLRL
ncbi:MAG: pyruvate kinase [Planctomycetes bacterium]|nr:pyruvate kinase [Planctomycetota bacterium]MCB9828898.1 pyruvate kinase [Planctomycetota bacterium]MCB9902029.1 pyruvate kinase [Planctomycetota bacterium]